MVVSVEGLGPCSLAAGTMLDDKYRIDRLLARGGMGAVYLGTHTRLRKRVAIKVLDPHHASDSLVERFHREAITASQIGHEGIAQVTDLGTSSDGEPFLVMEYLEGESLAARLRATGPMPVELACAVGCGILSPLAAAHHAGIVHRDLKPDNVFLVRQSRGELVKLLDFGISRVAGLDADARLTSTGLVLGTPFYMSPEQARGESAITPAADLYAFGVMLYEMLVGDVPIRADNYNQLMYRVTIGDYAPPRTRRPELPAALDALIVRAMAQAPDDRPASALELEHALLAFCGAPTHGHGRGSSPGLHSKPASAPLELPAPARGLPPAAFDGATHVGVGVHPQGTLPGAHPAAAANDPAAVAPALSSGAATTAATRPPRRRRAFALALAAVATTAVIALGVGLSGRGATPGAPRADDLPIPVGAPATTPTPTPAPTPGTVTLQLAVDPPTAVIMIDGRVTGTELSVAQDRADHQLQVTAPGYVAYQAPISFEANQRLVIQLRPTRPTRGRPATAPHPDKPRLVIQSPYSK
jgi:eukaryotic-like serine/threonine-protein kinase